MKTALRTTPLVSGKRTFCSAAFITKQKWICATRVTLKALSSNTGVALRWNSVFIFVASAAGFGFYMSAVSSRFNHSSQPAPLITYDVGESRERSSDRSRPQRERHAIAARRTALGKQRSLVSAAADPAPTPQSDLPDDAAANESFLNLVMHAFSIPSTEDLNATGFGFSL